MSLKIFFYKEFSPKFFASTFEQFSWGFFFFFEWLIQITISSHLFLNFILSLILLLSVSLCLLVSSPFSNFLIARHDIPSKGKSYQWDFSNLVVSNGGEAFNSPVITSQCCFFFLLPFYSSIWGIWKVPR